ncbi:hypothetical protein, partial [Nocardia noduli]|uniref:hypothetical protein n=1 Tax=Nocardia noduli TaxID=2815722 RepID=UPI001C231930
MTAPLLLPDPRGPYRARLTRLGPDFSPIAPGVSLRFGKAWMAREWLQHNLIRDNELHGGDQRYRAHITATLSATPLYNLSGPATDVAFRLALLGRTGFDEPRLTGEAALPGGIAFSLLRDYRACVTELNAARAVDPNGPRVREFRAERAAVRREIHAAAQTATPLSQSSHLMLAQAMLEIDTHSVARPDARYAAMYHAQILGSQSDPDTVRPDPVTARFESVRHAREWLVSQAATTVILGEQIANPFTIRAAVFDLELSHYEIEATGTPAQVGWKIHALDRKPDGIFRTGVTEVDHFELNRLVEKFEHATDYLLDAASRERAAPTDTAHLDRLAHILGVRSDIKDQIIARAESAAPEEASLARRRVRAAEGRAMRNRDSRSSVTDVASSGFVRADIQVALGHLAQLTAPDTTTAASAQETSHRISELRDHIQDLMNTPGLDPADHAIISAQITQTLLDQHRGRVGLYAWPSLSALDARTTELTAARARPGERGFADALRLHQLTQAIAADTLTPGDPPRRLVIEQLLSRQRDHLETAIDADTGLSPDTRAALHRTLTYDPRIPVPNQHAVAAISAHPADQAPVPQPGSASQDYMLRVHRPGREWNFGLEQGQWTLRIHQAYPAYSSLRLEVCVARFDSAQHMLDALTTGLTITDPDGPTAHMAPLEIPESGRSALTLLDQQRSSMPTPDKP